MMAPPGAMPSDVNTLKPGDVLKTIDRAEEKVRAVLEAKAVLSGILQTLE